MELSPITTIGVTLLLVKGKIGNFFFSSCVDDKPNSHVIGALNAHLGSGHRVEIWSGRSAVVEEQTREWLSRHCINRTLLTHIRPIDDRTDDDLLKENWLKTCSARPDIVYEDRDIVVNMFRRNLVPCFQVAPGNY